MFEKRIRIFGIFLVLVTLVLIVRAFEVQVMDQKTLAEAPEHWTPIETARGSIRDVRGREIARDEACIDACVDYRAITNPPDDKFVRDFGRSHKMKKEDVLREIDGMWATLATMPGETRESIDELRRSIVQKVEMRRRYVWYYRYQQAVDEGTPTTQQAWYKRWLEEDAPNLDDFSVIVDEQTQHHPILRAIPPEVNNALAKQLDQMPGLVLRAGTKRVYPYGRTGCQLVGNLSKISATDIKAGVNEGLDDLSRYEPNDLIGRSGLESLCEKTLRGKRGKKTKDQTVPPQIGADATTTVDIELQKDIEEIYENEQWHGAAVVIDIPTSEVRALASNPGFDPNTLDRDYPELVKDELNHPLLNRATQAMLEPGSTVKPMMALGGITSGIISPDDTIQCNGFLYLSGRRIAVGRCWTEQMYHLTHQQVPSDDPHPTGMLTVTDAIQRSCNVYFETLADRMGPELISTWFSRFGLGRPTGIGIAEVSGRVPKKEKLEAPEARINNCFTGIGQGQVAATPIQMANVAATIARDGIWMKPKLVPGNNEQVDLQLSSAALEAVKTGMFRVVNTPAGSAYKVLHRSDIVIAGKTGTAQAAPFMLTVKGPDGKDQKVAVKINAPDDPNPQAPWYRGTGHSGHDLAHAWFIGFAPMKNPQIAFAVMVEYGGGGGVAAAKVAREVIDACANHGYLTLGNSATAMAN